MDRILHQFFEHERGIIGVTTNRINEGKKKLQTNKTQTLKKGGRSAIKNCQNNM